MITEDTAKGAIMSDLDAVQLRARKLLRLAGAGAVLMVLGVFIGSGLVAKILFGGGLLAVLFGIGARDRILRDQRKVTARRAEAERAARLSSERLKIAPIWPPRKPDDWGLAEENAYRVDLHQHQQIEAMAGSTSLSRGSPPRPPMQKSWEAYHRAIQDNDPLQVRWAQNEHGEWAKVIWGNAARGPADGSSLPVFQLMKHKATGEWHWIGLGKNVALDWQRGPVRTETIDVIPQAGGRVAYLRPCGSPVHQDAPAPIKPADEHGSSDWQTAADLAALGAVRR